MNFIIFDLEATCWRERRSREQEIIEIGAVKMNEYGEVTGTFESFVRPIIHPMLSPFCIELTSITQVAVNRASKFPDVIEHFQDWIEIYDEEYLLCSWGAFDKKMLIQDCKLHRLEHEWAEPHINLKDQYRDIKGLNRAYGLKKTLSLEGFEFDGTHHRGIDDAINLSKIFGKYFDVWRY